MPSNLTWWEAARFARAGYPVRRESVTDPLAWYAHEAPGLFFYYEEENTSLGSPAPADTIHRVVQAAQFVAADFAAGDWTTFGVPAGSEVTPPSGGFPPAGGIPPDYPPPVTPPPVFPPDFPDYPPPPPPPPPTTLPTWQTLVATVGSGNSFACSGVLTGIPAASAWVCVAEIPLTPAYVLAIGSGYGPGNVSCAGAAIPPAPVDGLICTFRATCVQGAGKLRGSVVVGQRVIATA